MNPHELFHTMHRVNRQVLHVDELANDDLKAISNNKSPADHAQYNDELDD